MIATSDSATRTESAATDALTVREAAPIAGMTELPFYRAVRLKQIPPGVYWKIGRNIRVSRRRLTEWVEAGAAAHAA